jgi:putative transcriptional regulator
MIKMPNSTDLLIAPPAIPDQRFRKAVIMLTHDTQQGSFALCVNKPTDHTLQDILDDNNIEAYLNFPLYWGGPVSQGTVWMLHDSDWSIESTVQLNEQWSMTSNLEMFYCLADGDCPRHFRLMLGYCSWANRQLTAELRGMPPWNHNHSWLVAENPGAEWLFDSAVEDLWMETTQLSSNQAVDSWL